MEVNLTELTSKLYRSLQDENKPRELRHWHASSIAQCPRAQMYARAGIEPLTKPTGAKIIRWQSGHKIEGVIRPHLKKQFPNLISNVRFTNDEFDLTGEFDNYDPDSKTLIEIKSVSTHAVKYRKVSDDRAHLRDERPYLGHEYQQAAYILLMREEGTSLINRDGEEVAPLPYYMREVEQIIFIYVTLDGLLVPYSASVKKDIVENVVKRLNLLRLHWSKQTLPSCLCRDENHPLYLSSMKWCDYRTTSIKETAADPSCCSSKLWNKNE